MVYNMVKDSCQGTKEFVAWQKIVGLQIFSTPSLNFGDSWENFGKWKKSFALEVAPCWQIVLQNKQNFAWCEQGVSLKPYFLFRGILMFVRVIQHAHASVSSFKFIFVCLKCNKMHLKWLIKYFFSSFSLKDYFYLFSDVQNSVIIYWILGLFWFRHF